MNKQIFFKIKNDIKRNFTFISRIYCEYRYQIKSSPPKLVDVLDLTDKFLITGLNRINTDQSELIKLFLQNLLNQRKKRDLLIRYLINRNIHFDINIDEYIDIMNESYAENNLECASKSIL